MPRKKTPIPTTGTMSAVVVRLANENAKLKQELEDANSDLTDLLDRTLANQNREQKEKQELKRDIALLCKEIDGKGDGSFDWYIQKIRIMHAQLKRLRSEHAKLEAAVKVATAAGKEEPKEQAKGHTA